MASPRGEAGTSGFPCVSDSDRRVPAELVQKNRSRLVWRNGTLLASPDVHGVTGHFSTCAPPRGSLECNPEIPAFPGEENYVMQETRVRFLGQEDPLEEGLATHSSILAWGIPRAEEPCRLQSMGSQRVGPLGWTGLISLQSKGLSRVFSNTTVQKHQFFGAQPSSQSNSHIHT